MRKIKKIIALLLASAQKSVVQQNGITYEITK